MANLSDIARLAGVSLATVSRVVNGTARVAPEKRERILKAMRETGFQPVESAKAFYKQPSSLIGYVIPSLHNLFLNEIGTALEEAAQEKGYQVVVCDSGREPKREWHCYHRQQRRDGGGNPPVPPACGSGRPESRPGI